MAFQTGKDLQRAQLILIFPSGSYLKKQNENGRCSITVRTAYLNTVLWFPPCIHFSAFKYQHDRYLCVATPSELLRLKCSRLAHKRQKDLRAESEQKAKRLGQPRDRNLATSLLDQEFSKENMKICRVGSTTLLHVDFLGQLTALLSYSVPGRWTASRDNTVMQGYLLF